jgi:hypothetical protein
MCCVSGQYRYAPGEQRVRRNGLDVKEAWDWKRRQGEKKAKSSDQVLRSDSSALIARLEEGAN